MTSFRKIFILLVLSLFSAAIYSQNDVLSVPSSESFSKQRKPLDWFILNEIRVKTSDTVSSEVFVQVVIGYEKADIKAAKELEERKIELIDFLRTFFSKCSEKDLSPENEKELKIKIRDCINNEILCNSKILEVRFLEFEVKRK